MRRSECHPLWRLLLPGVSVFESLLFMPAQVGIIRAMQRGFRQEQLAVLAEWAPRQVSLCTLCEHLFSLLTGRARIGISGGPHGNALSLGQNGDDVIVEKAYAGTYMGGF
jgi:hypothetical protein